MKKIHNNAEMWPVYTYGDHPKGTATIGEMAGALMHGNPKTKANPNRVKAGSTKAKPDKATPNKRPGIFARLSRIARL